MISTCFNISSQICLLVNLDCEEGRDIASKAKVEARRGWRAELHSKSTRRGTEHAPCPGRKVLQRKMAGRISVQCSMCGIPRPPVMTRQQGLRMCGDVGVCWRGPGVVLATPPLQHHSGRCAVLTKNWILALSAAPDRKSRKRAGRSRIGSGESCCLSRPPLFHHPRSGHLLPSFFSSTPSSLGVTTSHFWILNLYHAEPSLRRACQSVFARPSLLFVPLLQAVAQGRWD